MSPSAKMELLKKYNANMKARNRGELNNKPEDSLKPIEDYSKETILRNDINRNGKEFIFDDKLTFDKVVIDDSVFQDDNEFRPISFGANVASIEETTKTTYEDIKQSIVSIDCSKGLDYAYKELDNSLLNMSANASSNLTNSQLLILVSTMIVKLEELNSYNYPELDLNEVKAKLDSDGKRAVTSSNFDTYFFTSFFNHYQTIELEQFNKFKSVYSSSIEQFSNFQKKKGEMLMTLLKWLIN